MILIPCPKCEDRRTLIQLEDAQFKDSLGNPVNYIYVHCNRGLHSLELYKEWDGSWRIGE